MANQEPTTNHDASEPATSAASAHPLVVVGLGNPGARYDGTRHNVGFEVIDELARRRAAVLADEACGSLLTRGGEPWLVKPQTFMNRSGFAVRCLAERHELPSHAFLIVYDDVHLPLGTLRLRTKGSPGGHRGLESILENLGTDEVPRLRLGVGAAPGPPDGEDLSEFVLGTFADDESEAAQTMIQRAADACSTWGSDGAEPAMQRFNGPAPSASSASAAPDAAAESGA